MNKNKRIISFILSFCMMLTLVPTKAFAAQVTAQSTEDVSAAANTNTAVKSSAKSNAKILGELDEKKERNIKHFLKEDGTYEADVYPMAVHYLDNGKWKDIDNTLAAGTDEDNNDVLVNKNNDFKAKFAKNSKANKLVRIQKDKYELSWNLEGAEKSDAQNVPADQSALNNLSEDDKKRAATKATSVINF
ncbi:MAG: hypothetical protein Q8936_09765, partial [Bacillota bacterium]|nr:hypothetical protein [Bacillota bacterium]